MKTVCLDEIIHFTLGKNLTRLKNLEVDLYTVEDFENDFHILNHSEHVSECIINLINSKASPLSGHMGQKCITSNYLKCQFDIDILNPWYFCYQFNEGKSLEQQIRMYHQGTTLSVKKLNVSIIGKLKFELLPIQKQSVIGELYRRSIRQGDLMQKQMNDMTKLTMTLIRKIEEDSL